MVDWLELLDPTIISSCPELQMKLVFGKTLRKKKNKDEKPSSDGNCRPYLLSLLTHQASYQVLRSTVSSLLSSCHNDFEPSSVLDFLSACIHIPRLWQGETYHKVTSTLGWETSINRQLQGVSEKMSVYKKVIQHASSHFLGRQVLCQP